MMRALLFVAIGGAAGSVLRYLTSVFTSRYFYGHFPLATFITNAIGCLLIGLLMGFFVKNNLLNSNLKWLLVTGFCGGYTTFSAFAFENLSLFQSQQYTTAFLYIAASIIIGLAAVWLGLTLTK
jgi:CrcB protein